MSIADELQKLEQLRSSGALSDEEFEQAKDRILELPQEDINISLSGQPDTLGKAANRYVSFRIVMGIIGLIIFLIFFLAVFLPMFSRVSSSSVGPMP